MRGELVELARLSRVSGASEYQHLFSPAFLQYTEFEESAERLWQFESAIMPGLLQTADYARALLRASNSVDLLEPRERERLEKDIEQRIEVRLARQNRLFYESDPIVAKFIFDEAVLRRHVGGVLVMREQIAKIREAAEHPTIEISVIPESAGAYPGMNGAFALLHFREVDGHIEDPLVYLEDSERADAFIRDDADLVGRYISRFEYLLGLAVTGAELSVLLDDVEARFTAA